MNDGENMKREVLLSYPSHKVADSKLQRSSAEREGFEPSVATSTTPVFETGLFNHSSTSPKFCSWSLIWNSKLLTHVTQ